MTDISDQEFQLIADFLKTHYGIHLGKEKRALVVGRLENVLKQKNLNSFSELYREVISDKSGQALAMLLNRLTTNHTYFMREVRHFEFFKATVLPYLAAAVADRDLRIWSAGCSSGEEPYTLAMILNDYFRGSSRAWDTKLLATDISTEVLEKAVQGIYPTESIAALPPSWQSAYFRRLDDERRVVAETIKNTVIYRVFNLKEAFPFKKKFHTIFCRNVMIYFGAAERAALLDKFYEYTEPGGYLFIGHSESINRSQTKYRYIMPAVYRKE
ncbi:CheR family methyltransferase [Propionispora hippei]|uniref:protein-glutamate O-methyltransferase n=1 Tax=Propionispora hippei DSM 15287 TaxID=1123003 RepID=A0A1M6IW50_9FIRM|nr:protein-glutamate O-methyltransferase CheR [Propionispora hippei]SHJ38594.1 chemotaxis protein methyltransferase CheR [Propionispora hippei DSM 15287]